MSNVTFKANRYLLVTTKRLTKQPKQMEKRGDGADKEKVSIPPPLISIMWSEICRHICVN